MVQCYLCQGNPFYWDNFAMWINFDYKYCMCMREVFVEKKWYNDSILHYLLQITYSSFSFISRAFMYMVPGKVVNLFRHNKERSSERKKRKKPPSWDLNDIVHIGLPDIWVKLYLRNLFVCVRIHLILSYQLRPRCILDAHLSRYLKWLVI